MKTTVSSFIISCGLLIFTGCFFSSCSQQEDQAETGKPKQIIRYPAVLEMSKGLLTEFPDFEPYPIDDILVDLRGYDLRQLDLHGFITGLQYADFSTATLWPYYLPDGYDPKRIMELGKNPGLGLKALHAEGYTGKGMKAAVISEPLLVDHKEYFENIIMYEEIPVPAFNYNEYFNEVSEDLGKSLKERTIELKLKNETIDKNLLEGLAGYKGTEIASLIAGKTAGIAPEAKLYYFAPEYNDLPSGYLGDYYKWILNAISRVQDINASFTNEEKIRAVFISKDLYYIPKAVEAVEKKIDELEKQNVFVLWDSSNPDKNEYMVRGLGRQPLLDPDPPESYGPGEAWEARFLSYTDILTILDKGYILVPGDSRTTASPAGKGRYVFNRYERSFTAPALVAGLYILSLSKNTALSPQLFIDRIIETGDVVKFRKYNLERKLYHIVNPKRLFDSF